MKPHLICIFLFILPIETIISENNEVNYEITDTLFYGMDVKKAIYDSKDTVWFISDGLCRFYNNTIYRFSKKNPEFTFDIINDIAIDSGDTLWLITEKGLISFDHYHFKTIDSMNVNCNNLMIDKNDNIWYFSKNEKNRGLIKYDKKNIYSYSPENSKLPSSSIRSIALDADNTLWVATCDKVNSGSIVKIQGKDWHVFNESNTGIPMYYFTNKTLTTDKENHLYVKIDYSLSSSFSIGSPSVIKYNGINWYVIDTVSNIMDWPEIIGCGENNSIWAKGIYNANLSYFDGNIWHKWGIFNPHINDISIGKDGNTWLCTNNGVYELTSKTMSGIKIQTFQADDIIIYLNPTTRYLTLCLEQMDYCYIYDISGVFLQKSNSKTIDMSGYNDGIYLLTIVDNNGRHIMKKIFLN